VWPRMTGRGGGGGGGTYNILVLGYWDGVDTFMNFHSQKKQKSRAVSRKNSEVWGNQEQQEIVQGHKQESIWLHPACLVK